MPPHPPPWASASPILISVVPLSVPLPPTLFISLPSRSPPTLPLAYDARRLSRAGVFYVLLTAKTGPPMRRAARAGASRAVAVQECSHAPNPISMLARGSRTPFSLSPRGCLSREERPELCPVRAWALGLETTRQGLSAYHVGSLLTVRPPIHQDRSPARDGPPPAPGPRSHMATS